MPCLKIFTNLTKSAIPNGFVENILPVLAKCVRKSEDKFLVVVSADCLLSMGGKQEGGVVANLESIGHLGPKDNQIISRDITDYISRELGIDKNQVFITFYDLLPYNVAKDGATREGLD